MKRSNSNISDWFQRSVAWWILFFFWIIVLCVVTFLPGRDVPSSPFPHFDKAIHFMVFLVGTAILFPAIYLLTKWPPRVVAMVTFMSAVILGILDEYLQLRVPGRSGGDWADIAANSLGAGVGVIMLVMIYGYSLAGKRAKARAVAARRD